MSGERIERLYERSHQRVFRLALRMTFDEEEAWDVVQEAFLRATRSMARLPEGEAAEEGWLVKTVVNLCRDRHRRESVRRRAREARVLEASEGARADGGVATRAVRAALAELAPRRRAVVVLHELEGYESREIAALLGVTPMTVRWHLAAARRELRAKLAPWTPPSEEEGS